MYHFWTGSETVHAIYDGQVWRWLWTHQGRAAVAVDLDPEVITIL